MSYRTLWRAHYTRLALRCLSGYTDLTETHNSIWEYKRMLLFTQKKDHLLDAVFLAKSLSSSEKIVALCLLWRVNEHGWADPTLRELSDMSRLHKRTVRNALRALEDKIELSVRFTGRSSRYTFIQWTML